MAHLSHPDAPDTYAAIRRLKWSETEKVIARNAFEHALQQELHEVIQKAKRMAAMIEQPADLWELESFLTRRRNEIDRKYDYRYSVLPEVFVNLVREGRIHEVQLHGLAKDKLGYIYAFAKH